MTGKTFGKYEIIELIGKGGMAEVYKAKDKELGRYVALKILPPHFASDEEFVNRFVREAKSSAKLNHSNIVTIYDAGKHEDTYYIAMEYLEGETLKEIISRQGALPIDKSINIATQVADGLNYAHSQKIIHRDIKPGNIVTCEDGRAVITDFGIAKALEGTRLTHTGTMIG
ncbi:MAG: serine/threonine-protein kinase, partial [Armatimonadetes bacterium CG07_land_8_20_14_0_80_40_9]